MNVDAKNNLHLYIPTFIHEVLVKKVNSKFKTNKVQLFATVVRAITPNRTIKPGGLNGPEVEWADGDTARKILSEKYKMDSVGIFSALHSTVWEFDNLWMMLCKNPMSNIQQASKSDAEKAKNTLIQLLTEVGNHSIDKPLMLSTASNLCIGRGISSS